MKNYRFLAVALLFLVPLTAKAAQPAGGEKIAALPLAGSRISLPGISDMNLSIAFDRAKNQVNGRVSVCRPVTNAEPRKMQSCQNIFFYFPALRYDDSRKAVLLGAEIVARDRGFWRGGWKLEADFVPEFNIAEKPDGDGFTQKFLELALAHKE